MRRGHQLVLTTLFLAGVLVFLFWRSNRADTLPPGFFNEMSIQNAKAPETLPIFAGCMNPRAGVIRFKSKVTAHKDFSDAFDLEKNPEKAIDRQLQFLQGYFAHGFPKTSKIKVFLLGDKKVNVLSVKPTSYGKSFSYDYLTDDHSLYPNSFLTDRVVRTEDSATTITYEAHQSVLLCGEDSANVRSIDAVLPRDPYLAFWLVSPAQRQILKYGRSSQKTNPCAFDEMADLKFPSMYWYVWSPHQKRKLQNGSSIDCDGILKQGSDYANITADFVPDASRSTSLEFKTLEHLPRIDISIVHGLISQKADRTSLDRALSLFKNGPTLLDEARKIVRRNMNETEFLSQDQAVWSFLHVLGNLDTIANLETPRIEDKNTHLLISIVGTLKASQKNFSIDVFFGSTDEPQKKAQHWQFLKESLRTKPIVFYVGHAGMGQNANVNVFRENSTSRLPYQLFAIVSCYANYYFGNDFFRIRHSAGSTSDLLLTAQGRYPFLTPIALLHFLDLSFAGKNVSLEKALRFGIADNESVIFRREVVE
ncbi:MAG TPA: hypothetical protein VM432_08545 [Bdellovibrionales bacterium]|nr:hypothetical protein [Bdellovibrionales bacterium]